MQEAVKPLDRNRLSVLVAMLLLGNVLFRFIELPQHTWRFQPLGSPLEIQVTGTWLLVSLMVGLVCTGTNVVIHDHPYLDEHPERPIYVSWILPGLLAGLSAFALGYAPSWQVWIAGLAAVAVAISLAIAGEYTVVAPDVPGYSLARLVLNMLAYMLAFALFIVIYQSRARSLLTATGTALTAGLVALDLLSGADVPLKRVLLFAGATALVIGECTWALNYWRISSWAGGLFLLLVFYVLTNVSHQHLLERLKLSTAIEFVAVAAIVLVLIVLQASL
jgi:hypothetical protein